MNGARIALALRRALELGERGVQVAAYLGDQMVIDEFAGVTDNATGSMVAGDTLFPAFSVTKVATAIAIHLQVKRGLISYDDPIAKHWPEFANRDKGRITVAHVLAHQSGIPQMPAGVTPELMCEWDWIIGQIEDFAPFFEAGTKNAYQSLIHGWILGEVVRRTDPRGRDFGDFVRQEICVPLKMDDFWIGLPAREIPRVAVLTSELSNLPAVNQTEESRAAKPAAVVLDAPVHNRHDVWQACLPATGAIMSARSGVRLFAMLANGGVLDAVRLLPEKMVRSFTTPPSARGRYGPGDVRRKSGCSTRRDRRYVARWDDSGRWTWRPLPHRCRGNFWVR